MKVLPRSRSVFASVSLALAMVGAVVTACAQAKPESAPDASEVEASTEVEAAAKVEEPKEAGKGNPAQIGATAQTSVLDAPWWPESGGKGSRRLGYLRHGAVVPAYDHPVANEDCKEGWYELLSGGYVCGKAATLELTSPKVRLAPKQPDRASGMPYRYGVNLGEGTPLYRKALGTDDRKKFEPWLSPPKEDDADKGEKGEKEEKTEASEGEDENKPSKKGDKGGPADAGVDASKPKLKELRGKGVLVRKMAPGFYLALDKEFRSGGARWWRTSFGFAVPHERIALQQSRTKHVGTWWLGAGAGAAETDGGALAIDAEPDAGAEGGIVASALAFDPTADAGGGGAGVVGFLDVGFARKIEITDDAKAKDGKKIGYGGELTRRTAVLLDGVTTTVQGQTFHHTADGFWVRLMDLKIARPAPPADLKPNEKWIDVDLARQSLVAFEGLRPVFATLISSGRRNPQDKEKDFPTPTGQFHIREKHVTTTMDGDVASDGPYSIEDVPWVMYFQGSYGFHGAFWHDAFGHVRSHGCVNMAPDDARTLFNWADPPLPTAWHGVFAKDDGAGTRVVVHDETEKKRH